jgi:hypothetical protein
MEKDTCRVYVQKNAFAATLFFRLFKVTVPPAFGIAPIALLSYINVLWANTRNSHSRRQV